MGYSINTVWAACRSLLARPPGTACGIAVGGLILTPIAMLLAVESSGAGEGDYFYARLLYPIPMLLTKITDDSITPASIALAFVQFPLFGLLASRLQSKAAIRTLFVAFAIHLIAVAVCFSGALPNFS